MTVSLTTIAPPHVTVGDPVRVVLTAQAPAGATVTWTVPPEGPLLSRESASPWTWSRRGDTWTVRRTETWASFDPGSTIALRYRVRVAPPGGLPREAALVSRRVAVDSVIARTEAHPRPAALAGVLARPYVPWLPVAGSALVFAALVLAFLFVRAKRREGAIPRTPDEVLESELALLARELSRDGPTGHFFDWLSEITRWYLEQQLGIAASRLTTPELSSRMASDPRGLPHRQIEQALALADAFRFARRPVAAADAERALGEIREAAAAIRQILAPRAPEEAA